MSEQNRICYMCNRNEKDLKYKMKLQDTFNYWIESTVIKNKYVCPLCIDFISMVLRLEQNTKLINELSLDVLKRIIFEIRLKELEPVKPLV